MSGEVGARGPAREDRWIAWALFVGAFAVLCATQRAVGYVRDESVYFAAAESYAQWFRLLWENPGLALDDRMIVRFWDVNHEHPALMKSLFGLSWLAFHRGLGLAPALAARLPAFAVAATIPALLHIWGSTLYGRRAGLFAALSFLLVPRQFFNSQLACFDVPIAAAWLFAAYAFWRAQDAPRWWAWTGVAVGLAIATKHNGLFLPFVLTPLALIQGWRRTAEDPAGRREVLHLLGIGTAAVGLLLLLAALLGPVKFQERLAPLSPAVAIYVAFLGGAAWALGRLRAVNVPAFHTLAPVLAMGVFGPILFYALWPYLWHHPVDRTAWYLAFHAQHNHYAWFYLGTVLRAPPFPLEYVLVKTALTVPATILAPMVLGFAALVARGVLGAAARLGVGRRLAALWPAFGWTDALLGLNAVTSIAVISHPDVPHFGGVKHWFPSMLFLGLLAGHSVARACDGLVNVLRLRWPAAHSWAVAAPVLALLCAPALIAGVRIHPYGTSFYAELAGGVPGAATLGMQRQFWSNNVTGVLPWLNDNAPRGARVWLHEVTGYAFQQYQQNGLLRQDLVPAGGPQDAEVAVYQYHQEFREQEANIWQAFGTQRPVAGLYVDETPQVVVYRRPR